MSGEVFSQERNRVAEITGIIKNIIQTCLLKENISKKKREKEYREREDGLEDEGVLLEDDRVDEAVRHFCVDFRLCLGAKLAVTITGNLI